MNRNDHESCCISLRRSFFEVQEERNKGKYNHPSPSNISLVAAYNSCAGSPYLYITPSSSSFFGGSKH